ncbi:MAG TPA: DUF4340 domain-containing protein [Polyangiaceae bacterium LLY-WYZ-14_1]|nr:DUF4340 domain-containing protein [Polyangiaceae bacterium LLY-WYZ-14_1]
MTKRTTWILAAIAGGLLAFILLYERNLPSTDELGARADRLLRVFDREEVQRVRVERRGDDPSTVVLVQAPPAQGTEIDGVDETLDLVDPDWKLTSPVEDDADDDAVEALLGALEWATPSRTLTEVSAGDRARFGLDDPRVVVTLTSRGDGETTLTLGGAPPQGGGVYVSVTGAGARAQDRSVVHVVGADVFEAVDQDVAHFRQKNPFADLPVADASSIVIRSPMGEVVLRENGPGDRWVVVDGGGLTGYASGPRVDELLRAVTDLRVETFVDETPSGDLGRYGLENPRATVRLSRGTPPGAAPADREPGEADGASETPSFATTLRLGDDCPERPGNVHARVDEGPVICVDGEVAELARVPAERFRERRLLTFRDDQVTRVRLEGDGRQLTLARTTDGGEEFRWSWAALPTSGSGEATVLEEGQADRAAVESLLAELRGKEADAFLPVDERKLRASGLAEPTLRVVVDARGDDRWEVAVGGRSPDGRFARRGDEEAILMVPDDLVSTLSVTPTRFRGKSPYEVDPDAVVEATVLRASGPPRERVVREASGWQVVEPVEVPGDRVAVRDLIDLVDGLRAEAWVAETPAPEHGLGEPRAEVSLVVEGRTPASAPADAGEDGDEAAGAEGGPGDDAETAPRRTLRLLIGAPVPANALPGPGADGDAAGTGDEVAAEVDDPAADRDDPETPNQVFASLGEDGAVFMTDASVLEGIAALLADRSALATDRSDCAAITLARGGRSVVLELERSPTVLDALTSLRARRAIAYLEPDAGEPAGDGLLRLAVRREEGAPPPERYVVVFEEAPRELAAAGDDDDDPLLVARRLDLPVRYLVPRSSVDPFLDAAP